MITLREEGFDADAVKSSIESRLKEMDIVLVAERNYKRPFRGYQSQVSPDGVRIPWYGREPESEVNICNCFYTKGPDSSFLVMAQYLSPGLNDPGSNSAGALWSEVVVFHKGDLDGRDSQILYDRDLEEWNNSMNSYSAEEHEDPESFFKKLYERGQEFTRLSRLKPSSFDHDPTPPACKALTLPQTEYSGLLVPIKDIQIADSSALTDLVLIGSPAMSAEEKVEQATKLWKDIISYKI